MQFQLPKINYDDSNTFFSLFIYLFIYLLRKLHYGDKNSETTKATNLKFGQMINPFMKVCACNFGGATLRGLGQMHPKLVTAKFTE